MDMENILRVLANFTLLMICGSLNGCFLFDPIIDLPRDVAIFSDHARARTALDAGDVRAAEGFLTGQRFTHRSREVSGMSWGELTYRAAQVVLQAKDRGESVEAEALYRAHLAMTYDDDLRQSVGHLQQAMQLLEEQPIRQAAYERRQVVSYYFPRLILYRYLESGGRVDWNSDVQFGLYFMTYRSPIPAPGEHDPRDYYRSLHLLSLREREWLFTGWQFSEPLDEAIWRDAERLRAFSLSEDYVVWFDENAIGWLLENGLSNISGQVNGCRMRQQGFDVIDDRRWATYGQLDEQTCQPL